MTRKKTRKGYKVVKHVNGILVSYGFDTKVFDYALSARAIRYVPGEPATPREGCGPLAVFKTRKQAMDFRGVSENVDVWECEWEPWDGGTRPRPQEPHWLFTLWFEIKIDGEVICYGIPKEALPTGTMPAKSVTLTRRLV